MGKISKKIKPIYTHQAKISSFFQKPSVDDRAASKTSGREPSKIHDCEDDQISRVTCTTDGNLDSPHSDLNAQLMEFRKKESDHFHKAIVGRDHNDSIGVQNESVIRCDSVHSRPRICDLAANSLTICDGSDYKTHDLINSSHSDLVYHESNIQVLDTNFTNCREKNAEIIQTPVKLTPDMIPDTPDPLGGAGGKKREYYRSFLKHSSVITDGVRKVTPRTKLRAKRLATTGPITVSFGKAQVHEVCNELKTHDLSSTSERLLDDSSTDSPSLIQIKISLKNLDPGDVQTKSEPLKRGAQSGLSPVPKRIVSGLRRLCGLETDQGVTTRAGCKPKRRICEGLREVAGDETMERNSRTCVDKVHDIIKSPCYDKTVTGKERVALRKSSCSNDYQLMTLHRKVSDDDVSCKDDRILDDILNTMQPCETNRESQKVTFSLMKKTNRRSFPQVGNGSECVKDFKWDVRSKNETFTNLDNFSEADIEMLKIMDSAVGVGIVNNGGSGIDGSPHCIANTTERSLKCTTNTTDRSLHCTTNTTDRSLHCTTNTTDRSLHCATNNDNVKVNMSIEQSTNNIKTTNVSEGPDFADDDFDECMLGEMSLEGDRETGGNGELSAALGRHTVTGVQRDSKTIIVKALDCVGREKACYLEGFWSDTHVCVGDIVNLTDVQWGHGGVCHINNHSGIIAVNPDILISGTSVVSAIRCMRQAVLNYTFKGCDSESVVMLYGSIIHTFFQTCLQENIYDSAEMKRAAGEIVKESRYLHDMYKQNITEADLMSEVDKYIPSLQAWLTKHTRLGHPASDRTCHVPEVTIDKICDIEENFWCPRFGIKGKVDVTAEVKIQKGRGQGSTKAVIPLELKTGKPTYSAEHQGQVTLYTMMMADRGLQPEQGLLLYLKDGCMKSIPSTYANTRGLVQLRNELAYYILNKVVPSTNEEGEEASQLGELPEPVDDKRMCERCPQLINCTAYLSRIDKHHLSTTSSNHAMTSLAPQALQHLSPTHLDYFTRWCHMLELEGGKASKCDPRLIWTLAAQTREEKGECLSDMRLEGVATDRVTQTDYRHTSLTFTRPAKYMPLSSVGISVGDQLVVSGQGEALFALTQGQVTSISSSHVTLITDKDITRWCSEGRVFRLDKCDVYNTMGTYFTNLSKLMANTATSERLRRLIIDQEQVQLSSTLPKKSIEKVKKLFQPLNKPQKTVVLKALMTNDYILVKGYPGTGKTSTIVGLVKILRALGHSVLLTSYTHSAVDNILLKLKQDDVAFVRLGRLSRIHPRLHEHSADVATRHIHDVHSLRQFYLDQGIVATTCLGMNHTVFTQRHFDVCIVDEASQVLQPACLAPLFASTKFILVGDSKQLPPVIQSHQARRLGMSESLFSRLESCGATFDLYLQYRMNKEVMSVSNHLTYDGALQCGNDSVANQCLPLTPHISLQKYACTPWLSAALSSNLAQSVIFLDTSTVTSTREGKEKSGQIKNEGEAGLVSALIQGFNEVSVSSGDIGVIAPYRNQVTVIKRRLEDDGCLRDVEVNTVDQYQGRDKSVIIISFTKSLAENNGSGGGELLKDSRRLNVAVTRARHKLMLIGNVATLSHYEPVAKVISLLRDKHLIFALDDASVNSCNNQGVTNSPVT